MPAMRVPVAMVRGLSVLLGLAAAPARAEPVVTQAMDYYDVTGATPQQVRASLDQLGPTHTRDGKRYDALTYGRVEWRFCHAA
jgi:predicted secreted Zn-dependent protease